MPYTMDNMPESMKGAPNHAMEIFVAAFNTAFEKSHVEGAAMAIAMAAVHKAGYEKDDQGRWVSPSGGYADDGNLTGWIPAFAVGTHTDNAGNTKDWTGADLDYMVASYDPSMHEAPETIGHPEDNSPAWGWVAALKREGQMLYYRAKDRVPEFVEMLKRKMFKKRSISVYPDGKFRSMGWLGAMPPAVKGLPDVAFGAGEGITIEFSDFKTVGTRSAVSPHFRKEAKRMKWFDWLKGKAAAEGVTLEEAQLFSEPGRGTATVPSPAEIKALVDAQVAVKEMEFAEKLKVGTQSLASEKAALAAEKAALDKAKADSRKADIASFCEGLCKEGKLTPAMMKYGMGMQNFLEGISGITTTYEFCEPTPNPSQEGKKQTPFEYAKFFLSGFKKQIEFGEFAGNEKDFNASGNAGEKLAVLTKKKMDEKKNLSYSQAFSEVQKENIELANEYAAEIR